MSDNIFESLSPDIYEKHAVIAHEAAVQMCSRLDYIKMEPELIIDLGCGSGYGSQLLKDRYPQSMVCGLDLAFNFLSYARKQPREGINWICAEALQLPLKEYSVDLIFANLLLPWCKDLHSLFQGWLKLLKPNGLLMFSTFGADTLLELKQRIAIPSWIDMHDIGDQLIQAGFHDPVLDAEHLTLSYPASTALMNELIAIGLLPSGLQADLIPDVSNRFPLTFELVYGHAWGAGQQVHQADENGVVKIPISAIKR